MSFDALYVFLGVKVLPLAYAIIGFGLLIAIHECGHFLFCKLFGIHTPTFSIGFGPEIFRRKIGKTDFRLAAIPMGGYVEIAGLAEVGQGDQAHSQVTGPESFDSKPYWQKLLVLSGGIIFNLIFAYLVFCGLFMIGSSNQQGLMVSGVVKASAAEKGGLKAGDVIIAINQDSLRDESHNLRENAQEMLLKAIRSNPEKAVTITVERDNKPTDLAITLGERKEGGESIGSLGAELRTPIPRLPFFQAIKAGIHATNGWIIAIVYSVKQLITQRSLEGAGGPVMIMSMSFDAAQHGLLALLTFLALISINLALINVLPIGALDGGQIFFVTLEAIIGRKLPLLFKNIVNITSWLFFISLAVFLTYRDIATLFGTKITGVVKKLLSIAGLR